jgi:hypothetical protein
MTSTSIIGRIMRGGSALSPVIKGVFQHRVMAGALPRGPIRSARMWKRRPFNGLFCWPVQGVFLDCHMRPPSVSERFSRSLASATSCAAPRLLLLELPPPAERLPPAESSVNDRSLRQGRQGDTIEAIAPDAATPRSRHVARRMDCGSSWTLLRITVGAVVDVGRAQVAARCAGDRQG